VAFFYAPRCAKNQIQQIFYDFIPIFEATKKNDNQITNLRLMKVVEHFKTAQKTLFSFEILPPLKGKDINLIYEVIDPLMEFEPKYLNITYHREEVVYKRHKSGLLEKKTVHKRPGTVAIAAAIKYKYQKVNVVPHIICGGFTREETENALIDLHFLGIRNLLVLRGDPLAADKSFIPEPAGNANAIDLIHQIQGLNKGHYLDEELENTTKMDFSLGVAGYPEKHIESANMETDLFYLKKKIEAGADYKISPTFTVTGKFGNVIYKDDNSQRATIGINTQFGSLSYRKTFGYAGELDALSIYTARSFFDGFITPSIGLGYTIYKLNEEDEANNIVSLLAGCNVRPWNVLSFDLQGQYFNNKIYQNDFRILFKLNYWFNVNL